VNKAKLIRRLGKQDKVMPLRGYLYSLTIVDDWLQRLANSIRHGKKVCKHTQTMFLPLAELQVVSLAAQSYETELNESFDRKARHNTLRC